YTECPLGDGCDAVRHRLATPLRGAKAGTPRPTAKIGQVMSDQFIMSRFQTNWMSKSATETNAWPGWVLAWRLQATSHEGSCSQGRQVRAYAASLNRRAS